MRSHLLSIKGRSNIPSQIHMKNNVEVEKYNAKNRWKLFLLALHLVLLKMHKCVWKILFKYLLDLIATYYVPYWCVLRGCVCRTYIVNNQFVQRIAVLCQDFFVVSKFNSIDTDRHVKSKYICFQTYNLTS